MSFCTKQTEEICKIVFAVILGWVASSPALTQIDWGTGIWLAQKNPSTILFMADRIAQMP